MLAVLFLLYASIDLVGSVWIDWFILIIDCCWSLIYKTNCTSPSFPWFLLLLAIISIQFLGEQWVIENKYHGEGYAGNTLTYVFPHYTGIVFFSWIYTVLYCFIMRFYYKKSPYVNSDMFVPAVLSGILWGIAEIAWFIANQNLGFAISFPLITSGPGFVGALWGVFRFNEIQGRQNFTMLSLAFLVTIPALMMVGWSH